MAVSSTDQLVHFAQVGLLQPVFSYLENTGVPIARYLSAAGVSREMLEDVSRPLPLRMIFKFINLACSAEGIEDIGLIVGRQTSLQMIGDYGNLLLSTKNIEEYLKQGCRQISKASSGERYWLIEEPDELRFCVAISSLNEQDKVQDFLFILLVTINTIGRALDQPWQPSEVTVPGMTDRTAARLASALPDTRIGRDGQYASMLIPYEILKKPMAGPGSSPKAEQDPFSAHPMPTNFLDSMVQLIETLIDSGNPTIEIAAEAAGMSRRTLQRKLSKHHTSFKKLLMLTRIEMAKRRLRAGACNLEDLATQLGYQNAGNFSRAFHRVTGQLPKDFRASNQNIVR